MGNDNFWRTSPILKIAPGRTDVYSKRAPPPPTKPMHRMIHKKYRTNTKVVTGNILRNWYSIGKKYLIFKIFACPHYVSEL
eukprot:SAG31_NODE_378_length_16503_cov_28.830041_4_plen_81_part_00